MTTTTDDLPADYPFEMGSTVYTGLLDGAEATIYMNARTYARDDLHVDDFRRGPEFEEEELNWVLRELRDAVTAVAGALTEPGPWRGIEDGDDVPRAIAEINALVSKVLVPAMLVEDAIVEARVSGLERQRGTTKYKKGTRWRARIEFEDQVGEALRESANDYLPLELRMAHLDRLIALAQLRKATLQRDHHQDAHLDQT